MALTVPEKTKKDKINKRIGYYNGKILLSDKNRLQPQQLHTWKTVFKCSVCLCACVHCAAFLVSLLYCILLEHQSFRTISPILAQFSAFWKEQRADCTNTGLTNTQTPDKGASCARVNPPPPSFFHQLFHPLSTSSVGRPHLFLSSFLYHRQPQVPFVYHSNGIKLGEVITAY